MITNQPPEWKQCYVQVVIPHETLSILERLGKKKKRTLKEWLRNKWFSIRWDLSNFILERD